MVALTGADLIDGNGKVIGIVYLWHITELLRYQKGIFLLVYISYVALMTCTYIVYRRPAYYALATAMFLIGYVCLTLCMLHLYCSATYL